MKRAAKIRRNMWPFGTKREVSARPSVEWQGRKQPVSFKGYRIMPTVDGWVIPRMDPDSVFDSAPDAKRFLTSWLKQRPNPGTPAFASLRSNITDRAHRYRANRNAPEGPKQCAFCGGRQQIMVGHVNGHEEDGAQENLIWTCRSCNSLASNSMRKAGVGRLTNQYNPTKSGGAATIGEWVRAVGSIVPHKGEKYAGKYYGLVAAMPVGEAVEMIRATPDSRRRDFAARLKRHRRNPEGGKASGAGAGGAGGGAGAGSQGGESHTDVRSPTSTDAKTTGNITVTGGAGRGATTTVKIVMPRGKRRNNPLLVIPESAEKVARKLTAAATKGIETAKRKLKGRRNPAGAAKHCSVDGCTNELSAYNKTGMCGWHSARAAKGRSVHPCATVGCVNYRANDFEAIGSGVKCHLCSRRNPAGAATEAFQDFHGRPSDQFVSVTEKIHHHGYLASAGELRMLKVLTRDGKATVKLTRFDHAILAFNEKRNQLFVKGGDQSVNLDDFNIDPEKAHEVETLGEVTLIDYFTDKEHLGDEGGRAVYRHKFRTVNENGQHVTVKVARNPDLIYYVLDQRLVFSGGSYEILPEGINR